ncbi:MAG: nickel pincer cofactor biosynthesis protein LarC [Lachnospiraceae bacterium]|nr:nickel pincer cofactor biosynthesis protein LarC [Lachnospiraceae bacterium]
MKTLYIDCGMGAAGDMLTAALYELLSDEEKELFIKKINTLNIPNVTVEAEKVSKCGIMGTHMKVCVAGIEEESHDHDHDHSHEEHDHHHEHSHEEHHHHEHDHEHHEHHHHHEHHSMADVASIIDGLNVSDNVKANSKKVYEAIAAAESNAHGVPVDMIHFHEVGSMDAIADVTAVSILMEMIKAERVVASSVHVGSGSVKCAHGILPVPAPATAFILKDVPIYGGQIKGELCTPTGAALLVNFVDEFGDMPVMKVDRIGYGMGKKDFERANCVRVMLGETKASSEMVVELICNLDDMTSERLGFAMETLLEKGALDVFTTPIGMKKSRLGVMLTVLCKEADKEEMVKNIFKYTTTLGIRENLMNRYTLSRSIEKRQTPYGEVTVKKSAGFGVSREKAEYEDLARIAKDNNIAIDEIKY